MIRRLSLLLCLLLPLAPAARAAQSAPPLIVVISVDQMRYDYLERFRPWFSDGGFNRFLKSGASFSNTNYLHAVTFTGPGHATIGSGKNPSEHGIVGNNWLERGVWDSRRWDWYFQDSGGYKPATTRSPDPALPLWYHSIAASPRYCVYDDSVTVTSGQTTGMSPRALIGESLGDRVKARFSEARVMAVSLKDRASILMGGRRADAAYWFDPALPGFVSSTAYHFNPALFAFNSTVLGYIPGSRRWNLSPFIPASGLEGATFDPPPAWPLKNTRYGGTFPHPINDVRSLVYTPYGNELVFDFALYTLAAEGLGRRPGTPDLLFVSVSSTDYYGHYYGPDSMEVADGMVRLDRSLERFLDALDRRFGEGVLVALTADHGVQSNPEILRLRKPDADAGRVDLRNPDKEGRLLSDLPPARLEIERQLATRLHLPFDANAPYAHALVFFFEEPSLYLNDRRIGELKLDRERVKTILRNILLNVPGVEEAWTDSELRDGKSAGEAEQRVIRSYLKGRSGDVLVTLKPNWIWTWGSHSTTHGQPVPDDMHVPLLFWGRDLKSGVNPSAANPDDLARTLGACIGVDVGGVDSHILPVLNTDVLAVALRDLNVSASDVRIDRLEVNGDRASVTLWSGRPSRPPEGVLSLDCGVGHTYILERKDGKWEIVARGVMQC